MRISRMLALLALALAMPAAALAAAEAAVAEPDELAAPAKALLSPTGARLDVSQRLRVREEDGKRNVVFALPASASNLRLSIPGHTIVRWSTTPILLNQGNPLAGRRARIEREKVETSAALMTVNSRLGLWQALPKSPNAQDIQQLQTAMQQAMPELALRQAALQRRLRLLDEELSRMPPSSGLGERVRVDLADSAKPGEEIVVDYSYNHDGCGWEAVYDFNAKPEEGSGDVIDARLMAEIWQFTGIDWKDTEITLASRGSGPRQPAQLPEWVIDSAKPQQPQPRSAAAQLKAARPVAETAMLADNAEPAAPAMAGVAADQNAMYATWKLAERGLPQGRSRLQITAQAWRAPLQWLARPSQRSDKVWLMAKCELPADQAWPSGLAEYSVDGNNVGSGEFRPEGGEATLYFGADPRVTIETSVDSRKRGDTGFINTSRQWTWSWTYTLRNSWGKPIKVRVERPAPMIVDQDVTLASKNNPAAREDAKQHMYYWEVDVPAHGKREIEHSVTISSPNKLPLLPDVP